MSEAITVKGALEMFRLACKALAVDETVSSLRYELAAGASAQAINFGPITTASVVLITSKNDIEITFNGADTAVENNDGGFCFLWNTAITSISITEPDSSTTAIVRYWLGGT